MRVASFLALLSCTACGPSTPGEAAARARDELLATWREDPAAGLEALRALPTDLEQMEALEALITSQTQGDEARWMEVCATLSSPAVREHCELRLARRPHLWAVLPPRRTAEVVGSDPHRPDATGLPACPPEVSPFLCRSEQALARAAAGGAEVGAPCDVLEEPRLRQECRFEAAGELVRRHGPDAVERAATLCAATPVFGHTCAVHLVAPLASWQAGVACRGGDLSGAVGAARRLQEATEAVGTSVYPGLFWNYLFTDYVAASMGGETCPTPVSTGLPTAALPHLRAALALGVVARHRSEALALAPLVKELEAAMDGAAGGTLELPTLPHLTPGGPAPDREPPRPGRVRYLMRDGLRASSSDARADAIICLLHAAARLAPAERGMFEEARAESDPGVQETVRDLEPGS